MSRILLADIIRLPEFQSANRAQQLWVKLYLASGEATGTYDALTATRLAYPKCAPEHLATRTSHVQSHKRIREILAIAFDKPMLVSVLPGLDRAIQKAIKLDLKNGGLTIATQRSIQFYEHQVRLSREKEAEDGAPKYSIGQVIEQDGKPYRVIAVEIEEEK